MGTSQLVRRSTRHTIKSCDELTVVSDGVVTSWVDCPFWPSIRPIQELRRRQWLRYCTLAISMPSVLSTVSGCYMTGVQIKKKLRLVALLYARLWRVDCVTRRLCDELTVCRRDRVTSWLVAINIVHSVHVQTTKPRPRTPVFEAKTCKATIFCPQAVVPDIEDSPRGTPFWGLHSIQELTRRWDSERELLRSMPGSYPNLLK